MSDNLTLSVIMPSLNEENNIEQAVFSTLDAFKKYSIQGEIIVVNDGSTDNTRNIVENIIKIHNNVRLISHDKPEGIGYSFWDGIKSSAMDVVVMFPGDNENDPEDALSFLPLMHHVDIIIPFIHNREVRDKKRRFISTLYRSIINISFGINLNYTNGTTFYRRAILDEVEINNFGFFYQAELLIKLIRRGYLFAEVPNFLGVRNGGNSKATTLSSLLSVMKGYLKLAYNVHIKGIAGQRRHYKELYGKSTAYIRQNDFEERAKNRCLNITLIC